MTHEATISSELKRVIEIGSTPMRSPSYDRPSTTTRMPTTFDEELAERDEGADKSSLVDALTTHRRDPGRRGELAEAGDEASIDAFEDAIADHQGLVDLSTMKTRLTFDLKRETLHDRQGKALALLTKSGSAMKPEQGSLRAAYRAARNARLGRMGRARTHAHADPLPQAHHAFLNTRHPKQERPGWYEAIRACLFLLQTRRLVAPAQQDEEINIVVICIAAGI